MTEIITGLLAKISDGDRVRTYLLTTGEYHDSALASQIEFGTALPVIPRDAGLSIREQIMFQPQGGTSGVNISNIPLINSEGDFDDWGGWYLSGLEQIIKRGYADQAWADWTDLVVGVGKGKPEFIGRERVIVSVRDSFAYMSQPVANQVFDDTVGNDRLENVTVPMVFGSAYQVPALLAEPEILEYAVATNANDIPSVQEGGNPNNPLFVFVPNGFQLFASPTLKVTCDVTGPPLAEHETSDALANIGAFDNWTSGYPDGWTVREDSPYSVINEDSSGDAAIEATAPIDGDTGWINADAWEAPENRLDEQKFEPSSGTLVDVLEADDGTYASVTAPSAYRDYELKGSQFPFGLADTTAPVELDVRLTVENNGGGTVRLRKLYLKFPDGTARNFLSGGVNPEIGTKETLEYKIDNNLADVYKFTNDILEDPDTELVIEVGRRSLNDPSGSTDVRIHEVALKVHYGPIIDRLRLTTEDDVLTVGNRYQLTIRTRGGSGDSIKGFWGGVDSDTSEISGIDDPYAQTTSQLEGEDDFEFSFIAQGKKFAIEFDRGDGNGEQILERLELLDQSGHQERFSELVQYIHEQAGKTPADVCDITALDDLETKAENPRLGWWVKNETTREQLCILFAQSLGGATWGGLDGKWTAAQMRIPQQPDGDYLEIEGSFDPGHAKADPGKGLTDRVWAAKNWHPIPEDSTAGVTSTWTEADREKVVADWRITERADFSALEGFDPTEPMPTSGDSIYALSESIAAHEGDHESESAPTEIGDLTINGETLHKFDLRIMDGPVTVDAFNDAGWFTSAEDTHSAWIVVKGNLTIEAGQVVTPPTRKLFTVIYVDGDLTLDGEISMSKRGANHSESGSDLAAADILLYSGTLDGVEDPTVPATGAEGGAGYTGSGSTQSFHGNDAAHGVDGATGGGGSGSLRRWNTSGTPSIGDGQPGTSFSGGAASGGGHIGSSSASGEDAETDGGKGGAAIQHSNGSNVSASGGAGNPGGAPLNIGSNNATSGDDGTGGTLIVIVRGAISGAGSISADGADGGTNGSGNGGGSGAGSINILAASNDGTVAIAANGGFGSDEISSRIAGNGGDGTARILEGLT